MTGKDKRGKELRARIDTIGEDDNIAEKRDGKRSTPQGWDSSANWDNSTRTGAVTTGGLTEAPSNWDEILAGRGLDPEFYEIDGDTIKWASWDGWTKDADGESYPAMQFSYKADIRLKKPLEGTPHLDVLEMYKEAKKAKPPKTTSGGDATLMVALSDWQIGNPDGGGVEAQVVALAQLPGLIGARVKQLRKGGVKIGTIALVGLGDLYENCNGFYRHQEFTVELDMRTQERIIRKAIFDLVQVVSKLAPKIIVGAVGGNHGEHRTSGNRYSTTKADNTDVSVFEQVRDMCQTNPDAFGHIDWRIPNGELAISMELSGQYVAFTHGHIAKGRGGAMNTMWGWWEKQAHGRFFPGVADADYLICGHFHHLNVKEQLGRMVAIAPSLTDVSDYYGDAMGVMTSPGTLTMVFDETGWNNLEILA